MSTEKNDMRPLIELFQREAGGGVAKAVQVTAIFDSHGRLVGRTEARVVKLYPGNVTELIGIVFNNVGNGVEILP